MLTLENRVRQHMARKKMASQLLDFMTLRNITYKELAQEIGISASSVGRAMHSPERYSTAWWQVALDAAVNMNASRNGE
jgi:alkylated DNA nucleotide flippase Atl1